MNYIRQLNSFWRWRREHAIPASAQLLWYTLTSEQNQRLSHQISAIARQLPLLCEGLVQQTVTKVQPGRSNQNRNGVLCIACQPRLAPAINGARLGEQGR